MSVSGSSSMGSEISLIDRKTPEYLAQLLNDKKALQAFPNVFIHLEKILDEGIRSFYVYKNFVSYLWFQNLREKCLLIVCFILVVGVI